MSLTGVIPSHKPKTCKNDFETIILRVEKKRHSVALQEKTREFKNPKMLDCVGVQLVPVSPVRRPVPASPCVSRL